MDIDWEKVENDVSTFGIKIYLLEECIIGDRLRTEPTMEVFEGRCNINPVTKTVAFKRHMKFKDSKLEQKDVSKILRDFRHEITLMRSLKYPTNIVQIYGITFEERKPVLIVEVGNKTLYKYLLDKAESSTPATWSEKIKLCKDVSKGVRCLHDAGITHGDIKGENVFIFIESNGTTTAKLSGFGYSSTLNISNGGISGKNIFMTPEARGIGELETWAKNPTQDIFNFGLVTYQIANDGKAPYPEGILKVDSTNLHTEVLLANLPHDTPEVFRIIITNTTKYIPSERVSLDVVEKVIYDFRDAPFSQQVNTVRANTPPLTSLRSYMESQQPHLSPSSALEIIPPSLRDSRESGLNDLTDNSKAAELNEDKRSYEKAKNILESHILHNENLDINGLPIPPSLKPSIFYEYQQLAEVRDVFAQFMLGVCLLYGFGVERNDLKAVEYFTKAAEAGNFRAQNTLGTCYENGIGVIKDMLKAVKWYTMAAEAGSVKAQYNLGNCYEYGESVTVNHFKAAEWYTKAAEANFPLAQNILGILYEKGRGVTMDCVKAFELYTKAAETGNTDAQCNLGNCYFYGKGVTKDIIKALEWYKKAIETGNTEAQINLGYCYEYGKGVTKDSSKALELYKKAAEAGNARAKQILGYYYQYGLCVPKNEFKAVKWYTESAEAGSPAAQNYLGNCYEYGIGTTKDYSKAIELYTKAAKAGEIALNRIKGSKTH